MNVLIVGSNDINKALEQSLATSGIGVHTVPSTENLVCLKGKPGFFSAVTADGEVQAAGVIITQPPAYEDVIIEGGKALGLHDTGLTKALAAADRTHTVIFLLDYLAETPEHLAAKALKTALTVARHGRQVVFLSRFVKTSAYGMEQVYADARQAGVSFVKYERACCMHDAGVFTIEAFDGVFTSLFTSHILVAAGEECTKAREQIIQKFRLAKSNNGYINGNKFFLGPVLTSRRGVFYIAPEVCQCEESYESAVSIILAELHALGIQPASYAEVDAKKCAFCYTCHRVCPHGALEPDLGTAPTSSVGKCDNSNLGPEEDNSAMTCVVAACTACGACAAVCPVDAAKPA